MLQFALVAQRMLDEPREFFAEDADAVAGAFVLHSADSPSTLPKLEQLICAVDLGILEQPPPVWNRTIPLSRQALKALDRTMWVLAGELAALIGDANRASDH